MTQMAINASPGWFRWPMGTRVRKKKGSNWQGRYFVITAKGLAVRAALKEIDNGC